VIVDVDIKDDVIYHVTVEVDEPVVVVEPMLF
jgi:hypothetical protein